MQTDAEISYKSRSYAYMFHLLQISKKYFNSKQVEPSVRISWYCFAISDAFLADSYEILKSASQNSDAILIMESWHTTIGNCKNDLFWQT